MDNLKSLFGSSTGRDHNLDHLDLPTPPTLREIIDDIERCTDQDPVRLFAEYLRECAAKPITEIDDNEYSAVQQNASNNSKKSTIFPPLQLPVRPSQFYASAAAEQTQQHANEVYDKLKKFMLIMERSENLLEEIEPELKTLNIESKAFIEELNQNEILSKLSVSSNTTTCEESPSASTTFTSSSSKLSSREQQSQRQRGDDNDDDDEEEEEFEDPLL